MDPGQGPVSKGYAETRKLMRDYNLHTVCEEAACPNIGECWERKHATVMILAIFAPAPALFATWPRASPGRSIQWNRKTWPSPFRKWDFVTSLSLPLIGTTWMTAGPDQFIQCVSRVREISETTTIEIPTPDFRGKSGAIEAVAHARPDVFNHNLETVPRLYPSIRPGRVISIRSTFGDREGGRTDAFTKSGLMVGLGEGKDEVLQVMDDLRSADVDFLTIGQYLQPTPKHVPVARFVTPNEFRDYERVGLAKGFLKVASSPLTRSSHHADKDFEALKAAREAKLVKA